MNNSASSRKKKKLLPGQDDPQKHSAQLGEALTDFLKTSGITQMMKHPELYAAWERIVGPDIAEHTRIAKFQRGVLEVAVDSSSLLNDIQFHKAALLQDMRREMPKPFIANIFFVHRTLQENGGQ